MIISSNRFTIVQVALIQAVLIMDPTLYHLLIVVKRPTCCTGRAIECVDKYPPLIVDILRTDMAWQEGSEEAVLADEEKV